MKVTALSSLRQLYALKLINNSSFTTKGVGVYPLNIR